jgi:DNA polymerase I-like protein with 3'-5' exonuclease and polymerase domains
MKALTDVNIWDTETSITEEYKRTANPFTTTNYIVAQANARFKLGDRKMPPRGTRVSSVYYPDVLEADASRDDRIAACKKAMGDDWFIKLLEGTKMLVGHNVKFDILYALGSPHCNREKNRRAWMKWVVAGGTIWDTMLVEYLLEGQADEAQFIDLGTTAVKHGGNAKLDEVKLMWEQGVQTIDIPRDLLMDYLCGFDVKGEDRFEYGDIGNTEMVFRKQWALANERGQLRSILLNNGAMIFTIECELNGMHVDQVLGKEIAKELEDELSEKLVEVNEYVPKDLPFTFNWNSRFHKSALIFGGTVKYDYVHHRHSEDEWTTDDPPLLVEKKGEPLYAQKDELHYIYEDGTTRSVDEVDAEIEAAGDNTVALKLPVMNKSGKNKGEFKTKKVKVPDTDKPKTITTKGFYSFDGYTKPDKKWESESDKGVYSTAGEIIEALAVRKIPFLVAMARVQAITKDLGTYFIRYDEKKETYSGMLTMIQIDGLVHHMLNMVSTITARLSSEKPNMQNLSKGNKSRVKEIFVSRFAGGKIIQSDFSSLEVYVQAILTKCENLIKDLQAGLDMHCVRLAAKEKMTYEEVYHLCKVIVDKEWDYKRTGAKTFSFQRAYGAGNKTIADATGMPLEEVEALAAAEDARYPEVSGYFEKRTEEIKLSRIASGLWTKHPLNGADVQLGVGKSRTPDGKLYTYKESLAPDFLAKRGTLRNFMPTEIKNYEVQGTGGEVAKAGMYLTVLAFYAFECFQFMALLINQVHDAEYADAHPDVALKAAALLHACMTEASNFFSWFLQWPIPLPVPTDTTWGPSMAVEDKITDPEFEKMVERTRPWLRKTFMKGYEPTFTH